jgi:ubiquinone/menaquinone biosynthesis C-methylase UbiE
MSSSNEFYKFSHNYRKIHNKNLKLTGYSSWYFAQRKIREISNQIKNTNEPLCILDLGCGDGLCTFFLHNHFPNAHLHGLDISTGMIQKARQRNIAKSKFSTYDGKHIPYDDEYFNIIMVANVLHHITGTRNHLSILSECYRILNTKGILFVFEHNPLNPITCHIVRNCPFDKNAVLITHYNMRKILGHAGFVTTCRFIHFLPAFLHKLEFLEKGLWWAPLGGQYYYTCIRKTH